MHIKSHHKSKVTDKEGAIWWDKAFAIGMAKKVEVEKSEWSPRASIKKLDFDM